MTYHMSGPSAQEVLDRSRNFRYGYNYKYQNGVNTPKGSQLRLNPYAMSFLRLRNAGYFRYGPEYGATHFFSPSDSTELSINGKLHMRTHAFSTPSGWDYSLLNNYHIPLSENEKNTLRARLQKRITDATMELAVSLKELPESVRMILNMLQRLNNILIAARKRDLQSIADELGISNRKSSRRRWKKNLERSYRKRKGVKDPIAGVSGLYLEAVFGWNSLYQEIIATAEFMAALSSKLPREHAFATFPDKKESSYSYANRENYDYDAFRGALCASKRTVSRMDASFKVSFSTIITAAGLNLSAIWQVVPYSFIANWFVDLTSFLRQFELLNSLGDLQVTFTQFTSVNARFEGYGLEWYSKKYYRPVTAYFELGSMTRTDDTLFISFPPVRLPKQIGKYISASALLAQRFTR